MNQLTKNYIVKQILNWGQSNTDNFPWRNPQSIYESIIAEIMLIRTPPNQVLKIYDDFIKEFPSFEKLNNACYSDVSEYIDRIGLSWRTDILLKMSDYVVNNLKNNINSDFDELIKIPGLGEYTASAVLTYYFKKRALPIDSNTVRFIKRYFKISFDKEGRNSKKTKRIYDEIVPKEREKAVIFNESFLDFMRKICTVKKPNCNKCIISEYCKIYNN